MKKLFLLLCLIPILNGCWELERGEKTGNIVKVAKAGFLIKTWDAELIRGGLNDGSGSMGSKFDFAIENNELVDQLRIAMESHKQVNIKYHQEFFTWLRNNDEKNYFLDEVKIL